MFLEDIEELVRQGVTEESIQLYLDDAIEWCKICAENWEM